MTAGRVTSLYDVMDNAYDAPEIRAARRALGHVPIIDSHPRAIPGGKREPAAQARRRRLVGHRLAEDVRYHERGAVERVNGRLKDDFGARTVRVRGPDKVLCHLRFGVLALTAGRLRRRWADCPRLLSASLALYVVLAKISTLCSTAPPLAEARPRGLHLHADPGRPDRRGLSGRF